jgi:Mce-associated membrane protein
VLAVALVGVIVVFGTLTGLYLQGYLHARAVANGRDDALQAAKVAMPHFASYSYKTFDANVATAGKYLTPQYRTTYESFQAKAVRTTALKYHAAVTAEVTYAGVSSSHGTNQVRLVVFVNQTETNTKVSAPLLSQSRVRVEMRKVGGNWLIAGVSSF